MKNETESAVNRSIVNQDYDLGLRDGRDCAHGHLARKCEECARLDAEVEDASALSKCRESAADAYRKLADALETLSLDGLSLARSRASLSMALAAIRRHSAQVTQLECALSEEREHRSVDLAELSLLRSQLYSIEDERSRAAGATRRRRAKRGAASR